MGKINKIEQARRDGMDYAYRIVMQHGIEALGNRVDRNRRSFAPAFLNDNELQKFSSQVKVNCMISFTSIMCMVLHDKFGYGSKVRLPRFLTHFFAMADSLMDRYLTYTDIVQTLKEEGIVDLEQWWNFSAEALDTFDDGLEQKYRKVDN